MKKKAKPYVIVRTYSAGCFAGYLESEEGRTLKLSLARRLWYWAGAASLSQLAQEGTSKPGDCKFPPEVEELTVYEAIEKLSVTNEARLSIAAVKPWRV